MEIRIENESGNYTIETADYAGRSASESAVIDICNDVVGQECEGTCCWDCALEQIDNEEGRAITDAQEYMEWLYKFDFSECAHIGDEI